MRIDKGNESIRRNPGLGPMCPSQITWAAAVDREKYVCTSIIIIPKICTLWLQNKGGKGINGIMI
jgi:hypothetical protein